MRLIVISSPDILEDEAHTINQLFEAGMSCFHLRKPTASRDDLKALLSQLDPAFLKDVVLHQHHSLRADYDLMRLHYTESARLNADPKILADQLESGRILSSSVHDFADIPGLKSFEYVFYGPVFNSISKPGYEGNLSQNFRLQRTDASPKVIALGGIDHTNITTIKHMDFDGAAVLGAIWNNGRSPLINFLQLYNPKYFIDD